MSPENPARTSPEALSSRQEKSRGSLEFSFIELHQSAGIPEKVRRIPWRAVITRPFPSKWLEHLDDNFISIPIVLSVSPWNDSSEKKRAEKKRKRKRKELTYGRKSEARKIYPNEGNYTADRSKGFLSRREASFAWPSSFEGETQRSTRKKTPTFSKSRAELSTTKLEPDTGITRSRCLPNRCSRGWYHWRRGYR